MDFVYVICDVLGIIMQMVLKNYGAISKKGYYFYIRSIKNLLCIRFPMEV